MSSSGLVLSSSGLVRGGPVTGTSPPIQRPPVKRRRTAGAARVGRGDALLGALALLLGARAGGPGDGALANHPAAHGEAAPPLLEGPPPTDLGPPPRQHHSFLPFLYETECYQSPGDDYPSASRRGRPPP